MPLVSATILICQVASGISLAFYLYFDFRLLTQFRHFGNCFYACVLSMSVSGIVHLLFTTMNYWNDWQYWTPTGFWCLFILDNLTTYSEVFTMAHVAFIRFIATFKPHQYDKFAGGIATSILLIAAWLIGCFGAGMEPVLWAVRFNDTLGLKDSVKFDVGDIFNTCEQVYIFSFAIGCLLAYISISIRIKRKRSTTTGANQRVVEERKIFCQSAVITTILSTHRLMVLLMKLNLPDEEILQSLWLILLWLHHSLTPIICTLMSTEIRDLLIFRGKFARKRNRISNLAVVAVR